MICLHCGNEFAFSARQPNKKFCSRKCKENFYAKLEREKNERKSLEQWAREAAECNLDYGTYRGLIEQGHTFDELKAQNRPPRLHARRSTHHSFSTGDFI